MNDAVNSAEACFCLRNQPFGIAAVGGICPDIDCFRSQIAQLFQLSTHTFVGLLPSGKHKPSPVSGRQLRGDNHAKRACSACDDVHSARY